MSEECDLPTLKQILRTSEGIGDTPMDEEESREWFKRTVAGNRERRLRDAKESA